MALSKTPPFRVLKPASPHDPQRPSRSEATIVQQLVKLRKARGLSQSWLAGKVGVTQPAIAKIEALRVRNLRLGTLSRAAEALGASIRLVRYPTRPSKYTR
jgi:transcriptional regulator with XRE-family HTH domain